MPFLELQEGEEAGHENPVRRERTDYFLNCKLPEGLGKLKFEQFWCNDHKDGTFELCCIPMFTQGLALGDRVSVRADDQYLIDRVVVPSGHQTFRALTVGGLESGIPKRLAWPSPKLAASSSRIPTACMGSMPQTRRPPLRSGNCSK